MANPERAAGTKIVSIASEVVSVPFDMGGPYQRFAGTLWDRLEILLVRVQTEDGLVGWGEAFGHAAIASTRAALDGIVAPLVIGRDAGDISGLTRSVLHATHLLGRNGSFVYAWSGIEIALWDLLGKRTGQPVHRLLGAAPCTELPAYASLLNYSNDALVAGNTARAVEQGYRHVKLHEVTRSSVLAATAAAAGNAAIMLDTNCAWDVPTAIRMADQLRGDAMYWLEEPVWPPEDAQGLARVRQRGIPIAAGENVAGPHGFKNLLEAGALDIAQPSVTKIGGIGEAMRVATLCQSFGVETVPHCPYFGPGFVATLHIAAALPNKPLIEVLWLDMEANPFDPWVRTKQGKAAVPQGPGLGCDPDPDVLARYRVGDPHVIRENHA
jgi:L-alanine-DL-glutamate epimerase-like enolase superfamily enzyme